MASPQANAIKDLYGTWVEAMNANPNMNLDEMRELFDQWGAVSYTHLTLPTKA